MISLIKIMVQEVLETVQLAEELLLVEGAVEAPLVLEFAAARTRRTLLLVLLKLQEQNYY